MEGILTNAWLQGGALGLLFVVLLGGWVLERKERLSIQQHNVQIYNKTFDLTVELKVALIKTQEYLEKQQEYLEEQQKR